MPLRLWLSFVLRTSFSLRALFIAAFSEMLLATINSRVGEFLLKILVIPAKAGIQEVIS